MGKGSDRLAAPVGLGHNQLPVRVASRRSPTHRQQHFRRNVELEIRWVGCYHFRGKFAESRFERDCLGELAETFKTVCVDAAYCQFPSAKYLVWLDGESAQR